MTVKWPIFQNEDSVVEIGFCRPMESPDGWRVRESGGAVAVAHPLLNEEITFAVDDIQATEAADWTGSDFLAHLIREAVDTIDGTMSDQWALFEPRWDVPVLTNMSILIDSEIVRRSTDASMLLAEAADFIQRNLVDALRKMGYERATLTLLIMTPPNIELGALEDAVRRRHELRLTQVLATVLRGKELDASAGIRRSLPTPVATALFMFENEQQPQKRFGALRSVIESAFKIMALLSVLPLEGRTASDRLAFATKALACPRPLSFGDVMKITERNDERLAQFFPETMKLLYGRTPGETQSALNVLDEFRISRNDDSHGLPFSDALYRETLLHVQEPTQKLIEAFAEDWASMALVVPTEVTFPESNDDQINYWSLELRDATVAPRSARHLSRNRLQTQRVYLKYSSDTWHDVDPLFRFVTCQQCRLDELFMLDAPRLKNPEWSSVRAHRMSVAQ